MVGKAFGEELPQAAARRATNDNAISVFLGTVRELRPVVNSFTTCKIRDVREVRPELCGFCAGKEQFVVLMGRGDPNAVAGGADAGCRRLAGVATRHVPGLPPDDLVLVVQIQWLGG
jgi:hypothetical protein